MQEVTFLLVKDVREQETREREGEKTIQKALNPTTPFGISHKEQFGISRKVSILISHKVDVKILFPFSVCGCPSNVQQKAFSCFRDYSTQLLNMHKSSRKLFSGVDVETLRAFCSSYISAMDCIAVLKSNCPEDVHSDIDFTLINVEGAYKELSELCHDDNIYEIYARHQTCFREEGDMSEWCYKQNMNISIRFMSKIDNRALEELCGDINKVQACIKPNIESKCGPEAVKLVEILVKPMIRGSTQCDYRVEQPLGRPPVTDDSKSGVKTPFKADDSKSGVTQKRPRSGQQGRQQEGGHSGGSSLSWTFFVMVTFFLMVTS
ncbi:hypothetical protein ScPMuIL_007738 [Solemya velum]